VSISGSAIRLRDGIHGQEEHVKVMALIYGDESRWDELSATEREAVRDRYRAFADEARAAGIMAGGEELASPRDATTVRVRDHETLVTDGPYAEVKEALGGVFILDVASMDEAVEYAAKIPGAEHGAVEVRPLYVDEGTQS
jgi:hypothetical protein